MRVGDGVYIPRSGGWQHARLAATGDPLVHSRAFGACQRGTAREQGRYDLHMHASAACSHASRGMPAISGRAPCRGFCVIPRQPAAAPGFAGDGTVAVVPRAARGTPAGAQRRRVSCRVHLCCCVAVVAFHRQRVQVMRLHNELAAAANTEAHHIATHADLWRTVYAAGANEKYIPFLQTMPAFQELPPDAAAESSGSEYDTAVEEATRMMDASEIAEFKRNLSWALGEVRRRPPAQRDAYATCIEGCVTRNACMWITHGRSHPVGHLCSPRCGGGGGV